MLTSLWRRSRAGAVRLAIQLRLLQLLDREHRGLQAVVDVMAEVSDLIREVDDLRLEARIGRRIEFLRGGTIVKVRMLDDALAHLEAEIEAAEIRIAVFDPINRAQALRVVIEASMGPHQIVQHLLARMPERRMPEVVRERDRLSEFLIETECARDGARDLRRLHRVREAGAIVVALVIDEHLGLVFETAEGGAMNDAIAIALETGAHRMVGLGDAPSAAVFRQHRVGSEAACLDLLKFSPSSQHRGGSPVE